MLNAPHSRTDCSALSWIDGIAREYLALKIATRGYPAKVIAKNDVSRITYAHSAEQRLEK
jgi:hypothetical protein